MCFWRIIIGVILIKVSFSTRNYNLTSDSPSYAFHGNRLKLNGPITISSCLSCTLLVDASIWDYQGYEPFLMNGKMPDIRNCTSNSDPMTDITVCHYEFMTTVNFSYNENLNGGEYSISIRVKEYIDCELYKYNNEMVGTVYSLYPVYQNSSITIGGFGTVWSSMATIVARQATNPLTLLFFVGVVQPGCEITIMAGGSPGKTIDPKMVLDVIGPGETFLTSMIRSSVFTVYTPIGCRTDISYGEGNPTKTVINDLRDQGHAILTSYEYPWGFDEPQGYINELRGQYQMDNYDTSLAVIFEFHEIHGGILNILVEKYNFMGELESISNNTLGETQNSNYSGPVGQVVQYKWMPRNDSSVKGFKIRMLTESPDLLPTLSPNSTSTTTINYGSQIRTTTREAISLNIPKFVLIILIFMSWNPVL